MTILPARFSIIRGASAFHLARALWQRGFFRKRDIFNFAFQQARYQLVGETKAQIDEVRSRALFLMTGHSVAEVVAIGEEVYDQVLALRIFPGTQKLLDAHIKEAGDLLQSSWLATGEVSPDQTSDGQPATLSLRQPTQPAQPL